jgi:hypothetical protein
MMVPAGIIGGGIAGGITGAGTGGTIGAVYQGRKERREKGVALAEVMRAIRFST